uniref:Uncharacterized protein n=1 Tax=Oryza punctata TaxID=4537 RepID=A0A0E0LVP5_ORYPU
MGAAVAIDDGGGKADKEGKTWEHVVVFPSPSAPLSATRRGRACRCPRGQAAVGRRGGPLPSALCPAMLIPRHAAAAQCPDLEASRPPPSGAWRPVAWCLPSGGPNS